MRTSSTEYVLEGTDNVQNKFMHLTNYAVQKYSKGYGKFEKGNQLTFKDF